MITLAVKLGNTTISGITFSVIESRVDDIDILISNINNLVAQKVSMFMENEDEQQAVYASTTEDFSAALTLSIICTADTILDISNSLSLFLGIKSVGVELLP